MITNAKKFTYLILSLFLFLASFNSALTSASESVKQELNYDIDTEYVIDLSFDNFVFDYETVETQIGEFTGIYLPGESYNYEIGKAKLPTIKRFVEIPVNAEPKISLINEEWVDSSLEQFNLPEYIIPCQYSKEKIPESNYDFFFDDKYYSNDKFQPSQTIEIIEIGNIRSHQYALIEISPVQYKPLTGELKLMQSCEVRIDCPNSDMSKTYENIQRYYSKTYEQFLDNIFVNHDSFDKTLLERKQEGFLIITNDTFIEEIQPLAEWKEELDFSVTVTKTSDIPGDLTKENILSYIEDAYYNWDNPPVFVLLVGDTEQIPTFTGISTKSATDLYYVNFDGEDYLPDIFIGRFPAAEEIHVENMVEKTLFYEIGNFSSNDWIKKAAFIASKDYFWISEETHNHVIENYTDPSDYTSEKIYCQTYHATTQDVYDAINDGTSLVIYSGHGFKTGWTDGPPFSINDVKNLENQNMYPFVCSHACKTNPYDDAEVFGEIWLREANKAAIAFWGSSADTYWDEDSMLEKAMFKAWFDGDLEWIGGMTDRALLYLYENFSGGGLALYYFEAYNLNGDPSVIIWNDEPNRAPFEPDIPIGPDSGFEREELVFSANTTDLEGDLLFYKFDWGNDSFSDWFGPYDPDVKANLSHAWEEPGNYNIRVKAKDIHNKESDWSDAHLIEIIDNRPPTAPIMQGKIIAKTGEAYELTISSTDLDGHKLFYYINWGDGEIDYWLGPFNTSEIIIIEHFFKEGGSLTITARAKDILEEKGIDSIYKVFVIKNKVKTSLSLLDILSRIFDRFPIVKLIFGNF